MDIELDNRGLEPPQPMVRILTALADLEAGATLRVFMDREPVPLYSELERRGFTWEFAADDGKNVLRIWRAAGE